ncbi:hypothetical protein A9R00_05370 [Oleispira antarctica]|uniref:Uncharacterized protein n=1 Tax=Oleispira antarctica TaxID=188908 RepID=A0A1Y5HTB8_OLEAN|nr:hypothetical protein A9R00_05370 [Oleispira antarctica]
MKSQSTFSLLACMASLCLFTLSAVADEIKDSRGDLGRINDPVQDAKQAYHNGIKEFVGIKLDQSLLLPGLKSKQEEMVREQYAIRALNQRWQTYSTIEQDPRRMNQLKRYANRYNLTMIRLIEKEQLEQQRQYRY